MNRTYLCEYDNCEQTAVRVVVTTYSPTGRLFSKPGEIERRVRFCCYDHAARWLADKAGPTKWPPGRSLPYE